MSITFQWKVKQSRIKETALSNYLQSRGYVSTTTQDQGEFPGYDISVTNPLTNKITTIELKLDLKASTTNNVAVEVCKESNGQRTESGLTASTAHFWAFCFDDVKAYYLIKSSILGQMVKDKQYSRVVYGGDDNRSLMVLFQRDEFFKKCFKINVE